MRSRTQSENYPSEKWNLHPCQSKVGKIHMENMWERSNSLFHGSEFLSNMCDSNRVTLILICNITSLVFFLSNCFIIILFQEHLRFSISVSQSCCPIWGTTVVINSTDNWPGPKWTFWEDWNKTENEVAETHRICLLYFWWRNYVYKSVPHSGLCI